MKDSEPLKDLGIFICLALLAIGVVFVIGRMVVMNLIPMWAVWDLIVVVALLSALSELTYRRKHRKPSGIETPNE